MTAVPMNNYILCEQVSGFEEVVQDKGVYLKNEDLKTYRIFSISSNLDDSRFTVGDVIICNSTGTKFSLDDKEMFLFNIDNIAGVIK